MSSHIEPIVTVDDLAAVPEDGNRYEVIEGELFVSRAPAFIHQMIISKLIGSIQAYLDHNPIGVVVTTPGVIFSHIDGVIPDLVYVSHERRKLILENERLRAAPELIVEVMSPGAENERRDRIVKRQLYGKYAVREYWIIDPQARSIEVYVLRHDYLHLATVYANADIINTPFLPGWEVSVEKLFIL